MKYFGNLFGIKWENKQNGTKIFSNYLNDHESNQANYYCDTSEAVYCENENCTGFTSSITMLESNECGIFLRYESSNNDSVYYSLASDLSNKFCELGDNIFFPKACCLKQIDALKAVEEFFSNPKVLPNSILWINADDTESLIGR